MKESTLNKALRHFEIAEANLKKLEDLLVEINKAIPEGIAFVGENIEYEANCRSFETILEELPHIDNWKPEIYFRELDAIAQDRLDAHEVSDLSALELAVHFERETNEPGRLLREYRYRFNQKRKELIKDTLDKLVACVDDDLRILSKDIQTKTDLGEPVDNPQFEKLNNNIAQIHALLGGATRPNRWTDLQRHLRFGLLTDLADIINHDWPTVKEGLYKSLYGEKEPIPNKIADLSSLVDSKPSGPVAIKLKWEKLEDEDFERLIYALISSENGYENPELLMKTNAPDRGRDLSVYRVHSDPLTGMVRHRVIIQCKHWLSKSVGPAEVATLKEQMKLWEPPRIDIHIIATSGRFTSDAVQGIEKQNQSDSALRIEMWPESHLERLLASRPAIIAEFKLR